MSSVIQNPPNAAALMQSLRDIGYELDTALADIVDNSITASANKVHIIFETDPVTNVAIVDNGNGMSRDELIKAMTIGSKNPLIERSHQDLGRFGLGLKTASLSQCKRLTVVTRQFDKTWAMCWDIDQVTQKNSWDLIQINDYDIFNIYQINQLKDTGTLVVWESCDRLDNDRSRNNDNGILQKFENAESHLGLVFHRFLDKSLRSVSNLEIVINGREIDYVDPFFRYNLATQVHSLETIKYKDVCIKVQGYTLPHHSKCTKDEYEKYSLGSYRDRQGFYVYRANRLLIAGDWFRLAKKSDLTALARVKIDLPNNFDSEWHIDIKKSHARPPEQIRNQLKQYLDNYLKGSKRVYTSKGYRNKNNNTTPLWHQYTNKNLRSYRINKDYPLVKQFMQGLDKKQTSQLTQILGLIEESFPIDQLYVDYASSPKEFKTKHTDKELEKLAEEYLENFLQTDFQGSVNILVSFFEVNEPYSNYQGNWLKFLTNLKDTKNGI